MAALTGSLALPAAVSSIATESTAPGPSRLGLSALSCGVAWGALRAGRSDPTPKFKDAPSFLEYAHGLGAGGVQVVLRPEDRSTALRLASRAEALNAYYEAEIVLPREDSDEQRFEAEVGMLRLASATAARTVAAARPRYEAFQTAESFNAFRRSTLRALQRAEPILKRHRLRLALGNSGVWLTPELTELIRGLGSEWIGVSLDVGVNLALLEDPAATVDALAPMTFTVNLTDLAVEETEDGFALASVPLGTGFLDVRRLVTTVRRANRSVRFNLALPTRDPLRVPCLSPEYWATLGELKAIQLAAVLARIRRMRPRRPLARPSELPFEGQLALEEDNVRESLEFAHEHLGL